MLHRNFNKKAIHKKNRLKTQTPETLTNNKHLFVYIFENFAGIWVIILTKKNQNKSGRNSEIFHQNQIFYN